MSLEQEKNEIVLQLKLEEARLLQLQEQKGLLGQRVQEKIQGQKILEERQKGRLQREVAEKLIKGRVFFRGGQFFDALKEWEEVLLLDQDNETALAFIASCEKRLREDEEQKLLKQQEQGRKQKEIGAGWLEARKKYRQGLFEEAFSFLEGIEAMGALSPEMLELKGACLDRMKEVEAVLGRAKKEAEEKKREAQKFLAEARETAREARWKEAAAFYEKAFLLEPDNRLIQEEWRRAETELRDWRKACEKTAEARQSFESEWTRVKAKLDSLCLRNRFQEALDLVEKALLDFPGEADVLKTTQFLQKKIATENEKQEKEKQESFLRDCLAETARFLILDKEDEALSWCWKGLGALPGHPLLLDWERRIWEQKKRKDSEAEKSLSRWQEGERQSEATLAKIWSAGQEHWKQGRWREALLEWEKGKWVDPENKILLECLSKAERKIRETELKSWSETQEKSEKDLKIQQLWARGREWWREEKVREALSAWEEAWTLSQNDPRLGEWIRKAEGKLLEKGRETRKVSSLIFGATRHFNRGKWTEALRCLEEALTLDPENVEVKNAILQAEEKLGQGLPEVSLKVREGNTEPPPLFLHEFPEQAFLPKEGAVPEEDDMDSLIQFLQNVRRENDENSQSKIKRKEWKSQLSALHEDVQKLISEKRLPEARHLLESSLEMAEKEGVQSSLIARMKALHQKLGTKTNESKNVSKSES